MGVYLKSMKMPENCFRCDIRRSCSHAWYLETTHRPDDCPLIEIQEPHGRLVEFIDVVTYEEDGKVEVINFGEAYKAYCMMRAAKPVIEAEGE